MHVEAPTDVRSTWLWVVLTVALSVGLGFLTLMYTVSIGWGLSSTSSGFSRADVVLLCLAAVCGVACAASVLALARRFFNLTGRSWRWFLLLGLLPAAIQFARIAAGHT